MATIAPVFKFQFLDGNGNPLTAGKLYTYFNGTTVPRTTYTTAAETTPNTNPIILDSAGRADIFLTAGVAYKFVLANAGNVTQYTVDNITSAGTMSTQNSNFVTITGGTISGVTITGPITGDVTGNLTGNVTGNLTGNVTGGAIVGESYNGGQLAGLRNKIINGSMAVSQKGAGPFTTGTGTSTILNSLYMLDRWSYWATTPAVFSVTQQLDAPASQPNLLYSQRLTVTAADAVIAANNGFSVIQIIEGSSARTLVDRPMTVSFWVRSSVTGVYCLSLYNGNWPSTDQSYVAEYTINSANTWEYKTIEIAEGVTTVGTNWNWTNGAGLTLAWSLGTGSTFQTATPGIWTSDWGLSTSQQVNAVGTIGNIFALTGVQIETSSVATPFEHRPFGVELSMCQRYYEQSFAYGTAPAQNIGSALGAPYATGQVLNQAFSTHVKFAVTKRAPPNASLLTTYSPNAASANWAASPLGGGTTPTAAVHEIGESGFAISGSTAVTAGQGYVVHWRAVSEI
jgi:hypothetical protein